jgi:hypothetical protein
MEVREEVRLLAEPLAEEQGYELVDIEQAALGNHPGDPGLSGQTRRCVRG